MTPMRALHELIRPTLALLGASYHSPEDEVLLLAIGLQESEFRARDQGNPRVIGPARGFWQFEKRGGCEEFATSPKLAVFRAAARKLGYSTARTYTWVRIGEPPGDQLACIMARSLFALDAHRVPKIGDATEAAAFYRRRWRPGAWRKDDWALNYAEAVRTYNTPLPPDSALQFEDGWNEN